MGCNYFCGTVYYSKNYPIQRSVESSAFGLMPRSLCYNFNFKGVENFWNLIAPDPRKGAFQSLLTAIFMHENFDHRFKHYYKLYTNKTLSWILKYFICFIVRFSCKYFEFIVAMLATSFINEWCIIQLKSSIQNFRISAWPTPLVLNRFSNRLLRLISQKLGMSHPHIPLMCAKASSVFSYVTVSYLLHVMILNAI